MNGLAEKIHAVRDGEIHYWANDEPSSGVGSPLLDSTHALVFLPGLTADHRLFGKQVEYFGGRCRVLVWDAPGHFRSRPYGRSLMREMMPPTLSTPPSNPSARSFEFYVF